MESFIEVFEEKSNFLLEVLQRHTKVNVHPVMKRLTLDIICGKHSQNYQTTSIVKTKQFF